MVQEKLDKHLAALKAKHVEMDKLIAQENAHPFVDDIKIQEYKKQKLKIKQEIEAIEGKK